MITKTVILLLPLPERFVYGSDMDQSCTTADQCTAYSQNPPSPESPKIDFGTGMAISVVSKPTCPHGPQEARRD